MSRKTGGAEVRYAWPLSCLLAIVFLTACGKTPQEYYPMNKGAVYKYNLAVVTDSEKVKDTKSYSLTRTMMDKEKLNNRDVFQIKTDAEAGSSYMYIGKEEDGLFIYATQGIREEKPVIYSSPRYFLKVPLKAGISWDREGNTNLVQERFSIGMKYTIVSDKDVITVPAGTFNNCIRVEFKGVTEKSFPLIGSIKFNIEGNDWFAPGVGWVKGVMRDECTLYTIGSRKYTYELTSRGMP